MGGGADGPWGPYSKGALGNGKGWDEPSSWGAGKGGGDPSDDSYGPTGRGPWSGCPKGGPGRGLAPLWRGLAGRVKMNGAPFWSCCWINDPALSIDTTLLVGLNAVDYGSVRKK